jgi:diacylglycerol kinase (ATP)
VSSHGREAREHAREARDQVVRIVAGVPRAVDSGAATMRPPSTLVAGVALLVAGTTFGILTILAGSGWEPLARFDAAITLRAVPILDGSPDLVFTVLRAVNLVLSPIPLLAATLVLAGVLLARRARRLAAWLAVTVGMVVALSTLLGALIRRDVPNTNLSSALQAPYPSSSAAAVITVVCSFLIVAVLSWPKFRWFARTIATTVVALSAIGPLLFGSHLLTDIVGGWLLGVTVLASTMLSFGVSPLRRRRNRRAVHTEDDPAPIVAVVYNPIKVASVVDFFQLVRSAAEQHDYAEPLFFATTREDSGRSQTREALAAGATLVLVAGGDGTVRKVCTELARSDVPIGIIASGTGNLLARNLMLPLEQPEAIEVAFRGADFRMDLVRVTGDHMDPDTFVVLAGLGLDAAIVDDTGDKLKRQVGWMAYVVAGMRHISYPAVEVELTVDDEPPVIRKARAIMIGNVGTLTGGFTLLPDATPDDGRFELALVSPSRITDWPRIGWRVMARRHRVDQHLEFMSGQKVRVRILDRAVPRQLDGDTIAPGRELFCQVETKVLAVRVPR